jgi:hypothetical protein
MPEIHFHVSTFMTDKEKRLHLLLVLLIQIGCQLRGCQAGSCLVSVVPKKSFRDSIPLKTARAL